MDAAALRASIPAVERCTYLNTGATGPSPREVVAAATDYVEHHRFEVPCSDDSYQVARDAKDDVRAAVADLLGAEPAEIALTRSTVDGVNLIATAIPWQPGDVVVHTDLEHSTGVLPWEHLADRADIEVRVLETAAGRLDLNDVKDAVADARLLCLSSVAWNYGTRLPVGDVVDLAHDAGARVLVDAVQSPGQVLVDVHDWGADFVAGSGHKWLLGPWGAGFLYVDRDVIGDLDPSRIGYDAVVDANERPFSFEPGAKRFELGTTAVAPYVGLERAIELHRAVGPDAIQARIGDLAARLADGLGDRYLGPSPPESGLVPFAAEDPEATVERLDDRGIVIRSLPDPPACRASVHAFNTAAEVDALLDAL